MRSVHTKRDFVQKPLSGAEVRVRLRGSERERESGEGRRERQRVVCVFACVCMYMFSTPCRLCSLETLSVRPFTPDSSHGWWVESTTASRYVNTAVCSMEV